MVVFSEINAALELLSKTANAISKLASIDPQIMRDLEELRNVVISATGREAELTRRIQELEQQVALKDMVYDPDSEASFDPSDTERKRPLCTRCLEEKNKRSSLHVEETASHCRICQAIYQSGAQKKAQEIQDRQFEEIANNTLRNKGFP